MFAASWREELINQTWKSLEQAQPKYYRVLLQHVEHPELNAAEIAEQLAADWGKPMTAGHLRVTLHRARERFSDLLVQEVAHSLGHSSPDELLQELHDLRLLPLCEASFHRWRSAQI